MTAVQREDRGSTEVRQSWRLCVGPMGRIVKPVSRRVGKHTKFQGSLGIASEGRRSGSDVPALSGRKARK